MTKKKKAYVAPVTDSVELKTERILCSSPNVLLFNASTMEFGDEIMWDDVDPWL